MIALSHCRINMNLIVCLPHFRVHVYLTIVCLFMCGNTIFVYARNINFALPIFWHLAIMSVHNAHV